MARDKASCSALQRILIDILGGVVRPGRKWTIPESSGAETGKDRFLRQKVKDFHLNEGTQIIEGPSIGTHSGRTPIRSTRHWH